MSSRNLCEDLNNRDIPLININSCSPNKGRKRERERERGGGGGGGRQGICDLVSRTKDCVGDSRAGLACL